MDSTYIPPDIRWQAAGKLAGPTFWPRLLRGDVFRENAAMFMLANAEAYGDLLSMLISSVGTEGAAQDGAADGAGASMSDTQVRDECLTVMLAGHETTANALSFVLWLLAQHPDLQDELAVESARS